MSKEFDDLLSPYHPDVQAIARRVRNLIFDVVPDVSEHVYPALKVIRYGLEGNKMAGLVFFLMPHKERVNLGFNHGTSLPDPKRLLEGTGKNLRHVKLGDEKAVNNPACVGCSRRSCWRRSVCGMNAHNNSFNRTRNRQLFYQ